MKDERLYLVHMIECGERILSYTESGREPFLQDAKTQDAVIRNFEIIGEAAKRVSQGTQSRAPKIPRERIAGFRDVLIHQYAGVDLTEVWKRVEQDLLPLLRHLRALLSEMGEEE